MDLTQVELFEKLIEQHIPGFRLEFKDESKLHRFLGFLLKPFNPKYQTNFTTTLGKTVSFPSRTWMQESPLRAFSILAHEFVHLVDYQKHGLWFSASYLLPQLLSLPLLALGLLGLLWTGWASLLFIPAALCLVPWPSPWRSKWEARGYAMSLAVTFWATGAIPGAQKILIAKNFYGPSYYYMTWGEERALTLLDEKEQVVLKHIIEDEDVYQIVQAFMQEQSLMVKL